MVEFKFKNLQIGDIDIIGNKFNGHNLHIKLRERGIDSSHLVLYKESNDENTFLIGQDKQNRYQLSEYSRTLNKNYYTQNLFGNNAFDILYSHLFLESDVVHLHLLHNMEFNLQLLPILSRLKPIVWTIHDPWVISGHCIHHFNCDKWKKGCGDCPLLETYIPMAKDNTALNHEIKRLAIQDSDIDFVVGSNWIFNKLKQSEIFKDKNIHKIPFGVDRNVFKPKDKKLIRDSLSIPNDALVLIARCQRSEFKGFDYVEYVMENLITDKEKILLVVDAAHESSSSNYRSINYGWVVEDEKLSDLYNASDILLMPSIVDTFGMMAIEAMSCGVLPLVLEGTALPEVINSPECGVASKKDKVEYLNLVQHFVENPKEIEERGQKCLNYSKSNYDYNLYLDRIINVYENSIKRHKLDKNSKHLLSQLKKHMKSKYGIENEIKKGNINSIPNKGNNRFKDLIKKCLKKFLFIFPSFRRLDRVEKETAVVSNKIDNLNKKIDNLIINEKNEYLEMRNNFKKND